MQSRIRKVKGPVVGIRMWDLVPNIDTTEFWLVSPYARTVWGGPTLVANTTVYPSIPESAGIYSYRKLRLAPWERKVYGTISNLGQVRVWTDGYIAERAVIRSLFLPFELSAQCVIQDLEQRYQCPVYINEQEWYNKEVREWEISGKNLRSSKWRKKSFHTQFPNRRRKKN